MEVAAGSVFQGQAGCGTNMITITDTHVWVDRAQQKVQDILNTRPEWQVTFRSRNGRLTLWFGMVYEAPYFRVIVYSPRLDAKIHYVYEDYEAYSSVLWFMALPLMDDPTVKGLGLVKDGTEAITLLEAHLEAHGGEPIAGILKQDLEYLHYLEQLSKGVPQP